MELDIEECQSDLVYLPVKTISSGNDKQHSPHSLKDLLEFPGLMYLYGDNT